jgi:NDP-sugar pyrophosphorylase family protein
MKPTLLILAAGMGSRYGGLKQIDPVGPNGEIIIDYSIYDAIRAGFGKLVFVIRHYFEDAFKEKIGSKFDGVVETAYAYQELDAGLNGYPLPADREKPWGTGHAILMGKDVIDEPFAVINADDYYGIDSFKIMADFLSGPQVSPANYAMVGFKLRNTLSEYGTVARGICECDEDSFLLKVTERTRVEKTGDTARYYDPDGTTHPLTADEIVSMNLWGFHPSFFRHLEAGFKDFLEHQGTQLKSEYFITIPVSGLVETGQAKVKVLPTHDTWFGVTYKQDKPIAQRCIGRLVEDGTYPAKLWEK